MVPTSRWDDLQVDRTVCSLDHAGQMESQSLKRAQSYGNFTDHGRKGGKKSAKARMEKIPAEKRSQIALEAARARWAKQAGSTEN
jgi:hypothetical protein